MIWPRFGIQPPPQTGGRDAAAGLRELSPPQAGRLRDMARSTRQNPEGVLTMRYRSMSDDIPLRALVILALGLGLIAAPLAILAFLFF